jgi:hypothetical protein
VALPDETDIQLPVGRRSLQRLRLGQGPSLSTWSRILFTCKIVDQPHSLRKPCICSVFTVLHPSWSFISPLTALLDGVFCGVKFMSNFDHALRMSRLMKR